LRALFKFPALFNLCNKRVEMRRSGDALMVDGKLAYGATITLEEGSVRAGTEHLKRVTAGKPAAAPARWNGLIGEYGWDHNILYVLEREGKLYALVEWFFLYPLDELGPNLFAFPKSGLYDGEKLRFDRGGHGQATAVEVGGVRFARRPVGLSNDTFHIKPLKPVGALRTMAATDGLHISPCRGGGRTYGTPTWMWSVAVDDAP